MKTAPRIKVPLSNRKLFQTVCGALVFVAISILLMTVKAVDSYNYSAWFLRIMGGACVIFFGFIAVFMVRKLFETKPGLLNRTFETPLGVVLCELTSNKEVVDFICKNNYENGWSEIYESSGHRIELIEFKSIRNALVTDSKCWIFRIEKTNSAIETLEIKCTLTDPPNDIIFDAASGEHLDAIAAYNQVWQLNIGTEDEEIMKGRAERNDWLPQRLLHLLPVPNYLPGYVGFKTEIPNLLVGEQIYIQYLSAYDNCNDDNVNPWLAVEEYKGTLEKWIGIKLVL